MKTILTSNGWIMFYECKNPCAKMHFNHPDHPGYEVRVRTKSNTFSILYKNLIIAGPFWQYQLSDKLKEHVK